MRQATSTQQHVVQTRFGLQQEVTIWEYERGLLYRNGRLERVLEPGRYRFWRWERIGIDRVSMRQTSDVINGQEILTADKIEVRVSLIAQYAVSDPVRAITAVESYTEQLYQDLQLGLRTAVAGRTIDALLEAREEISAGLLEQVAPLALAYGLTLRRVGVRDIVLPGTVRAVFLKEVEADRTGRADLIKARHEQAAARARANTAKVLSENPGMLRLQELDALLALAGKQGNVVLLPELASLLAPRTPIAPTSES